MSSGGWKDKGRPTFNAETPHFFKIILAETIRDGKLGIPKRFVRKYGNGLSSPVMLKVPNGRIWQVDLTENNGEFWLTKGWQEFAEYYSVDHGHFLVFRYDGKSNFYVVIFDTSASEIEYPFHTNHGEDPNREEEFQVPKMEEIETDASVEILDDISPSRKRREKTPLLHFHPHKKMKNTPTKGTERSRGGLNFPVKEGGSMPTGPRCQQSEPPGRKPSSTAEQKLQALQRARAFKSENPFFMVTMKPTYIHHRELYIPPKFARKYFTEICDYITLRVSDWRTWPVKYSSKVRDAQKRYRLCSGWIAFVQDNNLEVGDICAFEMIRGLEISLKVVIFRDVEDAHCDPPVADRSKADQVKYKKGNIESNCNSNDEAGMSTPSNQFTNKDFQHPRETIKTEPKSVGRRITRRLSCPSVPGALEAVSQFKSKYPFFKVAMRPCYVQRGILYVPRSFSQGYIKLGTRSVMLEVDDKSWPVKALGNPGCSFKFSFGWSVFVMENALRVGDVCVFEMIKRNDIVLKVSIFRDG